MVSDDAIAKPIGSEYEMDVKILSSRSPNGLGSSIPIPGRSTRWKGNAGNPIYLDHVQDQKPPQFRRSGYCPASHL